MADDERWVGRLLVATPRLEHPTFRRTVILLLDHADGGAFGVVVNRPLEVDVAAVLPAWQPWVSAPRYLFQGGPVGLDSALGVVAVPSAPGGRTPVGVDRVVASFGLLDLDLEPADVVAQVPDLRIFAGYAGWSAGQLEEEVAEGSWWVLDARPEDPFAADPQELWHRVLRRQPSDLALYSTWPDDLTLN
ncbi:YqgE/AlgH family protein [Cellulomonas marina]|uniref:UPF0301 protein SAMN05421867_1245 n=1 Tax=Cellulomonas marina TaxID=988821 RepID=A0A1I1AVB3_9CELL|nr:YqgE/AlgH family protein [Cellulomonas marina]GIG30696.1 UPF0301 protein [Cellulomonas marina]SFB42025.1 putative transcriptional regulator [Cellulomonas marina]